MKKLSELKLSLEEYGRESYNNTMKEPTTRYMMNEDERSFIAGAVKYMEPLNILEIGVNAGGGALLLLELIKDKPAVRLTSIDIATNTNLNPIGKQDPVGIDVFMAYHIKSADEHPQWKLITGKDPSEVIEGCSEEKFDFVVLDTAHLLPVETLNFLTILPFLAEDAVIVLHDIGQQFSQYMPLFPKLWIGNKLLMDNIVAEFKTFLQHSEYNDYNPQIISNIVAIQLNNDTRKYIGNVFSSLNFPWGCDPSDSINTVTQIIEKYYEEPEIKIFKNSILRNRIFIDNCFMNTPDFDSAMSSIRRTLGCDKYIIYGFNSMVTFYRYIEYSGFPDPYEIWDNRVDSHEFKGVNIVKPHSDIPENTAIIITSSHRKSIAEMICCVPIPLRKYIVILEEFAPYKRLLR